MQKNEQPKHSVVKDYIQQGEEMISIPASLMIRTSSYYEQLSGERLEMQKNIQTDSTKFLSDLISAVAELKNQKTREVTLKITTDEHFLPRLITKTYLVKKESHNKR